MNCWNDKSGNNNKFIPPSTAPTYATGAINGQSAVNFAGSSYLASTLGTAITSSTLSFFLVAKRSAVSNNSAIISGTQTGANSAFSTQGFLGAWDNNSGANLGGYRGATALSTTFAPPNSVPFIMSGIFDGTNQTTYLNAVAQTAVASSGAFNVQKLHVATWMAPDPTNPYALYNGNIAEIAVYNTALSSTNRLNIETYLGNKWGIKINPPTSSGMKLWLDSADLSSLYTNSNCSAGKNPANNAYIGCWRDKSGNGNNATQPFGSWTPQYFYNAYNSLGSIYLDGTDDRMATPLVLNSAYTVIVLYNTNGPSAFRRAIFGSNNWLLGPYSNYVAYYAGGWVNQNTNNAYGGGLVMATATNTGAAGGSKYYVNGLDRTVDANQIGMPGTIGLGVKGVAAEALWGSLPEVIIYNSVLSNADRTSVQQYLGTKWGVTVP